MFEMLTILFSALLSSTALRFLICSSGSAHLTAMGVVLPSIRCFSSSADMACMQCRRSTTAQKGKITQESTRQGLHIESHDNLKPLALMRTPAVITAMTLPAKRHNYQCEARLSAVQKNSHSAAACRSQALQIECSISPSNPSVTRNAGQGWLLTVMACSRVCMVMKPQPLLTCVRRSRNRLTSCTCSTQGRNATADASDSYGEPGGKRNSGCQHTLCLRWHAMITSITFGGFYS